MEIEDNKIPPCFIEFENVFIRIDTVDSVKANIPNCLQVKFTWAKERHLFVHST